MATYARHRNAIVIDSRTRPHLPILPQHYGQRMHTVTTFPPSCCSGNGGGGGGTGAGSQGFQGPVGVGLQGPAGIGSQGNQGPAGSSGGSQGNQGPAGVGSQGNQGPVGIGNQGPVGVGSQGSQGPVGVGSQGPAGSDGIGFQGPVGIGSQGSQGPIGIGSQGPVGVGSQGNQGPIGIGSQGPVGVGNQGPSGGVGSQGAQGPASGGGGTFTVTADSGSSTGTAIDIYGQSVGTIPYSGIETQIVGTSLNIMNRRNMSRYVIDPGTTNPAEYQTINAAYADFLLDSDGGTTTLVVFLLRPGSYSFLDTLQVTKGGIIFQAVGGTTAANAVIFFSPGSLTGINIDCPMDHLPVEFHGITFGDSTNTSSVFTLRVSSVSTLLVSDCGASGGACCFNIQASNAGTRTFFRNCYFQVVYANALDFITIPSGFQNNVVTLVGCTFEMLSAGPTTNSIINAQGQVNLKVCHCNFTADEIVSIFTVTSFSLVYVNDCNFYMTAVGEPGTVFQVNKVAQLTIAKCYANGFYNFFNILNNSANTVTHIVNCNAVTTDSPFSLTNATTVGTVYFEILDSSFKNTASQNPAINYGALTAGSVQFRFVNSGLLWEVSGATVYAVYGGSSSTSASIIRGGLYLDGAAAVATNFNMFTFTLA